MMIENEDYHINKWSFKLIDDAWVVIYEWMLITEVYFVKAQKLQLFIINNGEKR